MPALAGMVQKFPARTARPPAWACATARYRAGPPVGSGRPPRPWQAVSMADDKPEPGAKARVTAELDELMATVLRHLRTGQGAPLEELGLDKAADELQHWRPDIPGSGAQG